MVSLNLCKEYLDAATFITKLLLIELIEYFDYLYSQVSMRTVSTEILTNLSK